MLRFLLVLAGCILLSQTPRPARALPVFAHRYGLSCQACHTTVPHLNTFGREFQARGYRIPGRSTGSVFPVAVKVNLAYSSDAQDALPKAVVDEVEILSGGTIGRHFNYFLEQYAVDGGLPGRSRDMWLQYTAGRAAVRLGQFTLPLPVDPETERDTQAHYLLYDQQVGKNPFAFFDDKTGVEASVTTPGSLVANLAAFHDAAMLYLSHRAGGVMLHAYRYQGVERLSSGSDVFFRQGFGLERTCGKLDALLVLQQGDDSDAGAGTAARSSGGFLEAHYYFSPALMAVARTERVTDMLSGPNGQTIFSLVVRPARNMRFTVEDEISGHHTLNTAWMFAY